MQDILPIPLSQVVWNEDLSIGITEVDQDHKRFIAMVNDLNRAIVNQEEREQIRQRLHLIILDVKGYFEHEQRIFGERGYPDGAHHAVLHTKLMGQIVAAMTLFRDSEQRERWIEMGMLIKGLLIDHLLNEDLQYRDFLTSQKPISGG
jgi:hemerythrin